MNALAIATVSLRRMVRDRTSMFFVVLLPVLVILVIGITSWPSTARLIRAQVLTLKERLYVDRSRALGASDRHLMARHIVPNVSSLILANTTLTVPIAILTETTLSDFHFVTWRADGVPIGFAYGLDSMLWRFTPRAQ